MKRSLRTGDHMPRRLLSALESIFGESADDVRLVEHSMYCRLHRGARATTRRNCILLNCSIEEFFADPELLLHEYYHVLRQWNRGRLSIRTYLLESAARGYRQNRYERQARRFVALRKTAFLRLIGSSQRADV
jgi:hypothetical protein